MRGEKLHEGNELFPREVLRVGQHRREIRQNQIAGSSPELWGLMGSAEDWRQRKASACDTTAKAVPCGILLLARLGNGFLCG